MVTALSVLTDSFETYIAPGVSLGTGAGLGCTTESQGCQQRQPSAETASVRTVENQRSEGKQVFVCCRACKRARSRLEEHLNKGSRVWGELSDEHML